MTQEALKLALEALYALAAMNHTTQQMKSNAINAIKEALAKPQQEPVLQDIEQYRMQMSGISTAAIGYWKEDDVIHPDYDTLALRDVAKLYAKYDALYKAQPEQEPVALEVVYETIIQWDEGGGKRSRRELARRIVGLYTTPPQRTWVGLTDDDIVHIGVATGLERVAVNMIEAKLKEKNA